MWQAPSNPRWSRFKCFRKPMADVAAYPTALPWDPKNSLNDGSIHTDAPHSKDNPINSKMKKKSKATTNTTPCVPTVQAVVGSSTIKAISSPITTSSPSRTAKPPLMKSRSSSTTDANALPPSSALIPSPTSQ